MKCKICDREKPVGQFSRKVVRRARGVPYTTEPGRLQICDNCFNQDFELIE